MSQKFAKLYTDLVNHPSVVSAPFKYKWVLITILDRMAFDKCQQDDHGILVDLYPGQLMCTERKLAEWAGVSKNDVHRALEKFSSVKILNLKVNHKKTIVTMLLGDYSKNAEPKSEPKVNQERTTKQDNIDNIEEITTTPTPSTNVGVVSFYPCIDELMIPQDHKISLMRFSEERLKLAIDFAKKRKKPPDDFTAFIIWHCQQEKPPVHSSVAHLTPQQDLAMKYNKFLGENGYGEIAETNIDMIFANDHMKYFIGGGITTISLKSDPKEIRKDFEESKKELKSKKQKVTV